MKAHDYPDVYEALGLDLNKLGCVMAPVETFTPDFELPLYKSPHPDRHWINGCVSSRKAHVTLLYGLLQSAQTWREHVERVMAGWEMKFVVVDNVGFFPSPYPDETYWCLIAKVLVTGPLLEGHQRLQFLPHVNTFPSYAPHVTIAYVDPIPADERDDLIAKLDAELSGRRLRVTGELDLGR